MFPPKTAFAERERFFYLEIGKNRFRFFSDISDWRGGGANCGFGFPKFQCAFSLLRARR